MLLLYFKKRTSEESGTMMNGGFLSWTLYEFFLRALMGGIIRRCSKHRLNEEGSEVVTKCNQLKLSASDGKYYQTADEQASQMDYTYRLLSIYFC